MTASLQSIFTLGTLLTTLRLAIPIALAAVGVTICERAGVLNLGVEGMMLMGAISAVAGSHFTGSPWFGVLLATLVGVLLLSKTEKSVGGNTEELITPNTI